MFYAAIARLARRAWGATPYFDNRKSSEITPGVLQQQAMHSAAMTQQLVEELASLAGNSETYDSRVPVTIELEGETYTPPDRIVGDNDCGDSLHGLGVSNPSSVVVERSDGELLVRNGYAIRACGASEFKANAHRDYNTASGETLTNYSLLVDYQHVTNLLAVKNTGIFQLGDTIIWNAGSWTTSSGADTYKVKLTTPSDTAKFLRDHFVDYTMDAFDATYDIAIKVGIVGGQLKLFLDASSITSFNTSANQALGHLIGQAHKYIDLSTNCSTA